MLFKNRNFINAMLIVTVSLLVMSLIFFGIFRLVHSRSVDELAASATDDAMEYLITYADEVSDHFESLWSNVSDPVFINKVRETLPQQLLDSYSPAIYTRFLSLQKNMLWNISLDKIYFDVGLLFETDDRTYFCTSRLISDDFKRDYTNHLLAFEDLSYDELMNMISIKGAQRYVRESLAVADWDNRMKLDQRGMTGLLPIGFSSDPRVHVLIFVDIDELQKKMTQFHYAGDFFMLTGNEEIVYTTDESIALVQYENGIWHDGKSDTLYMRIALDRLGLSCYLSLDNDEIYSGINNFTRLLRLLPFVFIALMLVLALLLFLRWHYPLILMAQGLPAEGGATPLKQIHSHIVNLKKENLALLSRLDYLEPAAYELLMLRLYSTENISAADAAQVRKVTGLSENSELRCVCIGCLSGGGDAPELFEAINSRVDEIMPTMTARASANHLFTAVIPWANRPAALQEQLEQLLNSLNASEQQQFAIGISDTYLGISSVSSAYKEAYSGWTDALTWRHSSVVYSGASPLNNHYSVEYDQLNDMYQALNAGNVEIAVRIFDHLVKRNFQSEKEQRLKQLYCQQFYYDIVGVLARVSTNHDMFDVLQNLFAHGRQVSLEEQIFLLRNALQECAGLIPLKTENDDLSIKVRNFCETHFHDPALSLNVVAEHFELSESSMSKFFKAHTGVTFSSFIENLRVRRAEEMLLDGKMPVRSIAEAVGYSNTTTFYNAFKRSHNCTPTQWLNLCGQDDPGAPQRGL